MSDTPWMNVKETAEHLRVSERHIHRLTKDEALPVERVGKRLVFHKDQVDDWVKKR
jgi:excisionase family DNA binding protein